MADAFCAKCGEAFDDEDRFCSKCGARREADPTPVAREEAKPGTGVALTLVLALVLGIVPFLLLFFAFGGGSVEGTLTVRGGPYGDFVFVPDGCQSMQPFGRAGANVHGEGPHDGGVYVTMDPLVGTRVDVEVPGSCRNADGTDCTVFAVPRDRCARWDVEAEFNGTVVNDVRQYRGHAHLDCVLEDGTEVVSDLTFGGC